MSKISKTLITYFSIVLLLFVGLTTPFYLYMFQNTTYTVFKDELSQNAKNIAQSLSRTYYSEERPWSFQRGFRNNTQGQGRMQEITMGKGRNNFSIEKSNFIQELNNLVSADLWIVNSENNSIIVGNEEIAEEVLPEKNTAMISEILEGKSTITTEFSPILGNSSITVGEPIKDEDGNIMAVLLMHRSVENLEYTIRNGLKMSGIVLAIILICNLILSIILSNYFLKPIREISKVTQGFKDEDYSERTNITQNDELGTLAAEINIVAAQLQEAKDQRDQSERATRNFLSQISHELRTPVTVIKASLEALRDGVVPKEDIQSYYFSMCQDAQVLNRLVDDLIDLSKLQNKEFSLDLEEVDFIQITQDALYAARRKAVEKNITLEEIGIDNTCNIIGDYGRLRQLILILLDNAIKFSENNSKIIIKFDKSDSLPILKIKDFGRGMDEEIQKNVYKNFFTKSDKSTKAMGMGLAIAREISKRHNMIMEFTSELNKGTEFVIKLPKNCQQSDT